MGINFFDEQRRVTWDEESFTLADGIERDAVVETQCFAFGVDKFSFWYVDIGASKKF